MIQRVIPCLQHELPQGFARPAVNVFRLRMIQVAQEAIEQEVASLTGSYQVDHSVKSLLIDI